MKSSFGRCCRSGDAFIDDFYANLCEKAPEIGPMFAHTDMERQNAMVRLGIEHLIGFAEQGQEAQAQIDRLGRTHGRGGLDIRPELYPFWVDALIEAAEHDPECSDELLGLWREVVGGGGDRMVSLY